MGDSPKLWGLRGLSVCCRQLNLTLTVLISSQLFEPCMVMHTVMPALGRLRQENQDFKANFGYRAASRATSDLKKKKKIARVCMHSLVEVPALNISSSRWQ